MRRRTAVLDRVRAVRSSLLPGMWILKWENVPASEEDGESGLEGVKIVVLGWNDTMEKELAKWKKDHPGEQNVDAPNIIKKSLESVPGLVAKPDGYEGKRDAVTVNFQTGPNLQEITLSFKFAPVPSADPNPPKGKGQKRRGRK